VRFFFKANVITVRKGGLVSRVGKRNIVNILVNSADVTEAGGDPTDTVSRILQIPRDKGMTTFGFMARPHKAG